jgi:hypothetical protein
VAKIIYWLIFMFSFALTLLLVGEVTHTRFDKCLTKRVALPGTVSDIATGELGGPYGDSGFIKVWGDYRTRVFKELFFGSEPDVPLSDTTPTDNKLRDNIPARA